MPAVEQPHIPDWAARERAEDLRWIQENLFVLWPAAQSHFEEQRRGAIVIDTTLTVAHEAGAGNPMYYLNETGIEQMNDRDALRMVRAYDP